MSINLDRTGESVYANSADYSRKVNAPLYVAARGLVGEYVNPGIVLDLGCSDGRVTHGLSDDFTVVGVDMANSALRAFSHYKNDTSYPICADINNLPFRTESTADSPKAALLIDVLEHVSWDEAIAALGGLQNILAPDHTVIVSMPIISNLSLNTWAERWQVFKAGQRPETGLYDRTHQILNDTRKHKQLFELAGYDIEAEYRTLSDGSVMGIDGVRSLMTAVNQKTSDKDLETGNPKTYNPMHFSFANVGRAVLNPRNSGVRVMRALHEGTMMHRVLVKLLEFQGLYVLKPTKSALQQEVASTRR